MIIDGDMLQLLWL